MTSVVQPLLRLVVVALFALGAAGHNSLTDAGTDGAGRADGAAQLRLEPAVSSGRVDGAAASLVMPPRVVGFRLAGAVEPAQVRPDTERNDGDAGLAALPGHLSGDGPVLRRICRVTAYHDEGITAAGVPSGIGQCAAPADIPLGSIIHIPALGRSFVVTDRTHRRFRQSTVDLFIPGREACRAFGRHFLEVEIRLPQRPTSREQLLELAARVARSQTG